MELNPDSTGAPGTRWAGADPGAAGEAALALWNRFYIVHSLENIAADSMLTQEQQLHWLGLGFTQAEPSAQGKFNTKILMPSCFASLQYLGCSALSKESLAKRGDVPGAQHGPGNSTGQRA